MTDVVHERDGLHLDGRGMEQVVLAEIVDEDGRQWQLRKAGDGRGDVAAPDEDLVLLAHTVHLKASFITLSSQSLRIYQQSFLGDGVVLFLVVDVLPSVLVWSCLQDVHLHSWQNARLVSVVHHLRSLRGRCGHAVVDGFFSSVLDHWSTSILFDLLLHLDSECQTLDNVLAVLHSYFFFSRVKH